MMDVMLPGGLLGWGLIVHEQHERLQAEARGDRLAREARLASEARLAREARVDDVSSPRRFSVRRVVAWRAGTATPEGCC